jgi:ArsR family metal-binding transcriptional regulator
MTEDGLLWHSFTITHVYDCIADPAKNRVMASFSDDISPVFPYLNASVPNLMYNPAINAITVRRGRRILTFYPEGASMAKVDGAEDAVAQLEWFRDLCNETWRRRNGITPRYERRKHLGLLDVYVLLPKLNCRACGEATCMAFGHGLLAEKHMLEDCPYLGAPEYAGQARQLTELLYLCM